MLTAIGNERGVTLFDVIAAVGIVAIVTTGVFMMIGQTMARRCLSELIDQQTARAQSFARGTLRYINQNKNTWPEGEVRTITAEQLDRNGLLPDDYRRGEPDLLSPLKARARQAGTQTNPEMEAVIYEGQVGDPREPFCGSYEKSRSRLEFIRDRAVVNYSRKRRTSLFVPVTVDVTSLEAKGPRGGFTGTLNRLLGDVTFDSTYSDKRFALVMNVVRGTGTTFDEQMDYIENEAVGGENQLELFDKGFEKLKRTLEELNAAQGPLEDDLEALIDDVEGLGGLEELQEEKNQLAKTVSEKEEKSEDKTERIKELQKKLKNEVRLLVDKKLLAFSEGASVGRQFNFPRQTITLYNPVSVENLKGISEQQATLRVGALINDPDDNTSFDIPPGVSFPIFLGPGETKQLPIVFMPGTPKNGPGIMQSAGVGEHVGSVNFADGIEDTPDPVVELSGQGLPYVGVNTDNITFDDTEIDAERTVQAGVGNPTDGKLDMEAHITSETGDADDFSVRPETFQLNKGQTRNLDLTYEPNDLEDGTDRATLSFTSPSHDLSNTPLGEPEIDLAGNMTAPLTVSSDELTFGSTAQDEQTTESLTLDNPSGKDLNVVSSVDGDDAGSFTAPSNVVVPANGSKTIQLTHDPEDASDDQASVTYDATNHELTQTPTVSLNGKVAKTTTLYDNGSGSGNWEQKLNFVDFRSDHIDIHCGGLGGNCSASTITTSSYNMSKHSQIRVEAETVNNPENGLEVYVNGTRVIASNFPSRSFATADISGVTGSGKVEILIRKDSRPGDDISADVFRVDLIQ